MSIHPVKGVLNDFMELEEGEISRHIQFAPEGWFGNAVELDEGMGRMVWKNMKAK